MSGYAGRILRVNLSERKISFLETRKYEQWVGGHGIGSAIFWELVRDKAISGFDPRNVVTIMTSPLTGTLAPAASGQTEVQGIGVQSYPIEWFTRCNFGGRFGGMLKFAGWDGIVIEGKANQPVWIDIRNGKARVREAGGLWGLDTWKTQEEIWRIIEGEETRIRDWMELKSDEGRGRTMQKPAVLTIGPAGENLCRVACLIHDAGNSSGQGGFGAVWGSKNLKAISVVGTGSVPVADPNALMEARIWAKKIFSFNHDESNNFRVVEAMTPQTFGYPAIPVVYWQRVKPSRPQACLGCHSGCRARNATGLGNESYCEDTGIYAQHDLRRHAGMTSKFISSLLERFGQDNFAFMASMITAKQTPAAYQATDLAQKYGINAFELLVGIPYLQDLYLRGVLGPGKQIDCDLSFDKLGEFEFAQKLFHMIAYREGIGNDIAEGFFRAARKWGRLEEDLRTGLLPYPQWGLPNRCDPRAQIEWGYGSVLGDRDINEHDFLLLSMVASMPFWARRNLPFTAEEIANKFSEKMVPFAGDPLMLDYSTGNIYSKHMVKLVAWHRYYSRFWKNSVLYCDLRYSDFVNTNTPDRRGITGEGEPRFFRAVTGRNLSFAEGIELGRKIWTLDNAIWTLQGRHRDLVHFADYIYRVPETKVGAMLNSYYLPGRENGEWKFIPVHNRHIDKAKFEDWKTKYYTFEGWDTLTGWPTRKALESQGLRSVADELGRKKRLGKV